MELSLTLEDAYSHQRHHTPTRPARKPRAHHPRPRSGRLVSRLAWLVYSGLLAALLVFGWSNRLEKHWIPESGIGYWLGIIGAVVMLALLVYPLRKRFRSLWFLGSVPFWFRLHMAFGLLGPALILLHCNFSSASLNATVALYSMLIVAGSGLIGRFLYARVHSTLSGRRRAATSFFEEDSEGDHPRDGNPLFRLSERSLARVDAVTRQALAPPRGIVGAIGHAWLVRWQTRQLARLTGRELRARSAELERARTVPRRQLRRCRRDFERDFARHVGVVRKAANLAIYERLFSLWHFLHMPLFMMLVIAVIVHIIAVHLY